MNTSLGYAKKTLTNSNVLLSGGGDKALSEFIGSLNWDSTNKKLQYKSASSTNFTDLITFGSNAFTSYSGYNIVFLNNAGTTVDTFKALTSPSKTLKAGTNVQMTAASNVITISATDTTYSNVSKSAAGLCPILPNETTTTKYLRLDGTWAIPNWEGIADKPNVCTTDTSLQISGQKKFNTQTNTVPVYICRNDSTTLGMGIGVNDSTVIFNHKLDERAAHFLFLGEWTNSANDGADAGSKSIWFYLSSTSASISIDGLNVIHSGNIGSQSVNYATSAGSANSVAWANVTGKPDTFTPSEHTHSYLPLSGGTMTGTLTLKTNGTGNYNQGIRINRTATDLWALLLIGKSGNSTSGTGTSTAGDGAWLIGTPASSNSLIFNLNSASESKGLCLKGHGTDDMKWNNNTVYHAGNLPAYPTKASWNYDDVYVKSVSLSGDSLRINKNGTNTDLTIPYASKAASDSNGRSLVTYKEYSGTFPPNDGTLQWYTLVSFTNNYYSKSAIIEINTRRATATILINFYDTNKPYITFLGYYGSPSTSRGGFTGGVRVIADGNNAIVQFQFYASAGTSSSYRQLGVKVYSEIPAYWVLTDSLVADTETYESFLADVKAVNGCFTGGGLMPTANNIYSIGSSSFVYSDVYATTFHGTLSGNASSANYATTAGSAPASDVYAWAKAAAKPSYTLDEVSDGSSRKLSNYLPLSGGTMTGLLTTTSGSNHKGIKVGNTYINAIDGNLILQNNSAIRFGGDSWKYNIWAGLKYDHSSKIIYLGLADKTIFTANDAQSGGKLYLPGVDNIYTGNGTNLVYHAGNLPAYPTKASWNYNDMYVASVSISGNSLRVNKNGSNSDLTIPYATDADTLDSYHEISFFRYRGLISTNYVDLATYTANATNYQNPDNGIWMVQRDTDSASLITFTGDGSASGLDIYFTYSKGGDLKFRRRIDSNRLSGAWETFITSENIGSQSVNYATSAGSAGNVTGTVAIANGGTGATTRLNALKALTNENVSTNATFFLTITNSWGKGGYTSVADAKTVLAMTGATSSANGTAGVVPAPPKSGYNTKFLRADGTWTVPPDTTYNAGTLALYNTGTDTENRVWSASVLKSIGNQYLPLAGGSIKYLSVEGDSNTNGYIDIFDKDGNNGTIYASQDGFTISAVDTYNSMLNLDASGVTAPCSITATSFVTSGSSSSYVVLGDGTTKTLASITSSCLKPTLSNLANGDTLIYDSTGFWINVPMSSFTSGYLAKSGGTMTGNLTLNKNSSSSFLYFNIYGTKSNGYGSIYVNSDGLNIKGDTTTADSVYVNAGVLLANNDIQASGSVTASLFIVSGGTSSQFLKADGSLDSTTYATTSALSGYLSTSGGTINGDLTIASGKGFKLVPYTMTASSGSNGKVTFNISNLSSVPGLLSIRHTLNMETVVILPTASSDLAGSVIFINLYTPNNSKTTYKSNTGSLINLFGSSLVSEIAYLDVYRLSSVFFICVELTQGSFYWRIFNCISE